MEDGRKGRPMILNKLIQNYENKLVNKSPTTPILRSSSDVNILHKRHHSNQLVLKNEDKKQHMETTPIVFNISKDNKKLTGEFKLPSIEVVPNRQASSYSTIEVKKRCKFSLCKCFF
jgi:hypothetical protein